MQSSSLLPTSSVRNFRLRAPRTGPPLTLVAAGVLLLGSLAGALASAAGPSWLDSVAHGVRELTGWPGPEPAFEPFDGPIAMPVRVPLDPALAPEAPPVAVAEVPVTAGRVESDGGPLRPAAAAAPEVGAGSGVASGPSGAANAPAVPAATEPSAGPSATGSGTIPPAAPEATSASSPRTAAESNSAGPAPAAGAAPLPGGPAPAADANPGPVAVVEAVAVSGADGAPAANGGAVAPAANPTSGAGEPP